MEWIEFVWEFIKGVIAEYQSAITKITAECFFKYLIEKFYSQKKKITRSKTMKKVKVNEKNEPVVSKGRGSRNPEKGYVRTHGFSCHDEYWLEITDEAYSRNLSVGQYLTLAHRLYMNANKKERVFDTKK